MTKRMVLSDGVAYVEAPKHIGGWVCDGCELASNHRLCALSEQLSVDTFGGDCDERKVIYIKADPQPVKAEG